jgi:folate-binding protein YgfZ
MRDTTADRCYVLLSDGATAHGSSVDGGACFLWNLIDGDGVGVVDLRPETLSACLSELRDRGYLPVDSQAFTTARIEAGVPLLSVDFDEHNFPQEVDRNREAISFTKGCYLGQETVARIDALGHVNQKIVGVRFAGTEVPAVGTELFKDGANVGKVSSAAFSPRFQAPLALAMVRREANSAGTRLESAAGIGEVIALPAKLADE